MSSILNQASLATPSTTRDSKNKLLKKWRANYCLLDDEEVEPYGLDVTTNMKGYLELYHEIIVPKDLTHAEGTIEEFNNQILADSINLKVLIEALITLIVPDEGLITTSHSRVYKYVKKAWETYIDTTSPNRYLLFIVCAHFTLYDNKKFVEDYMRTAYDRAWDALEWRIRYIRHIINLGHNIVVYIRGSPLCIAAFKKNPFLRATLYAEGDSPSIDATLFIIDSFAYEHSLKKEPPEIDDFDRIIMALRTTTVRPLTSNEYTDYNTEESYSPAINILSILLISDELERDRGRLEAETIEMRECLKY
ncbi:hypothetical protein V8E51_001202 [Hyaloscypha variabilis]